LFASTFGFLLGSDYHFLLYPIDDGFVNSRQRVFENQGAGTAPVPRFG
jgi:hypothetical protein